MAVETSQPANPSAIPMDRLWQDSDARGASEPALVIDVGGFEGPLDLLLHLARTQKVDLHGSPSSRWRNSISSSSIAPGACESNLRPIIWSWPPGSPTSNRSF